MCMDDDVKRAGMGRVAYSTYLGSRLEVKYRAVAGLSWSYGRLRYQQLEGTSLLACDPELLIPLPKRNQSSKQALQRLTARACRQGKRDTTEAGTTCDSEERGSADHSTAEHTWYTYLGTQRGTVE